MSFTTSTALPQEAPVPLTSGTPFLPVPGGPATTDIPASSHEIARKPPRRQTQTPGTTRWHVVMLPVERIDPNPWQPRTHFDAQEMEELVQSVKAHGVQQPVLVRTSKPEEEGAGVSIKSRSKKAPTRYHLVAGERRLRACRAAGKKHIPAIVRDDLSDLQVAEIALLENIQRANLSSIEEAKGYFRLLREFHLSEDRIAKKAGKSLSVVQGLLKLLALPESVQTLLHQKHLSMAHGHELLRLTASPQVCQAVAAYAVRHQLPASSLARDPLPNTRELEKKKLLVPLDYRTRFDKAGCKTCPHKAHVTTSYAAYCLLPLEWKRKQDETLAREADEAARVLDEARRQSDSEAKTTADPTQDDEGKSTSSLPMLSQLPRGSYRNLRFGEIPTGCSAGCPCRGAALDAYRAESDEGETEAARVPLCLDPARFEKLQKADRERHEEERRLFFAGRFETAVDALQSAWTQGETAKAVAITFSPLLDARSARGVYMAPSQWDSLLEGVAKRLQVALPCDQLFDEEASESNILNLLAGQVPNPEQEAKSFDPAHLMLLGAAVLLAHEAQSAARWGGETPLLDFVLPPNSSEQTCFALEEGGHHPCQNEEEIGEDEDPFMEEDFGAASAQAVAACS